VRSRAFVVVVTLLFAILACGCVYSRAAGRAFGSFFAAPATVPKTNTPITKDARLAVLWVGHATMLLQMGDKVILTDPVFTSTVGQLSKRLVEPGVDPERLPSIDVVLVSHMHFDHLSLGSLSMLEDKTRTLLLPRGGTAYLTDFRFPSFELRPWQSWERDGLRVTAVPVEHTGWRYGPDAEWMRESFTGYVIEHDGLKVYFGGDTAYDQRLFVEAAETFSGIDVALLPIGPIEPRAFMRRHHMDPAEAVQAFRDLRAKRMVPMHYGTFINSTDEPGDALRLLSDAKKILGAGQEVVVLGIGERRVFVKRNGPELPPLPDAHPPQQAPVTPRSPSPSAIPSSPPEPQIPDDDRLD
jgi:N-acyl-phosphatidylethanolamine-hydrolysing phospholipase D